MNLEEYYKENKDSIKLFIRKNNKINEDGNFVIAKNDEWINETEWDDLHKELCEK